MNASGLWQSASGLFDAGLRQARHAFGYDAVDTGEGKRRSPSGVTRSEDDELPVQKRRKLLSQTRDLARNFALLGWAIRHAAECAPEARSEGSCQMAVDPERAGAANEKPADATRVASAG